MRVGGVGVPEQPPQHLGPRARAFAGFSITTAAAPSEITKPSRSAANGRDASVAFCSDSAPMRANPETTRG